jgi:hypothetical protein
MLTLALSIADDEAVQRRLARAQAEGDTAAIGACRRELNHRDPLRYMAEAINAQRQFERGLTRRR